jgi:hypothetical protein
VPSSRSDHRDSAAPEPPAVACAFCGATDTELVAAIGSTLLTRQHRCRACGSYFESVRRRPA